MPFQRCNNAKIHRAHARICGRRNKVVGPGAHVNGRYNRVISPRCVVNGDHNYVVTMFGCINGDFNHAICSDSEINGIGNIVVGRNNRINGVLVENSEARSDVRDVCVPDASFLERDVLKPNDDDMCMVCYVNRPTCAARPCGHMYFCVSCSRRMILGEAHATDPIRTTFDSCPACRKPVDEFIYLFRN